MGEDFLASLADENSHLSKYLSMDSIPDSHDDSNQDLNLDSIPDSHDENNPPPQLWNHDLFDMLDVSVGQVNESDKPLGMPKIGRKRAKRLDCLWGAWFFFTFYFKPILKEKSTCNIVRDTNGFVGFDKSDLQLDVFLVQHDMENMYMWVFKERPENALGKMQLRSYMNGHSRPGERPFPFIAEKGFLRSHKMQRRRYKGLSNPVCVHAIELVPSPNFTGVDDEELMKWMELTGRDLNFSIPPEAKDFSSWRNLPNTDFELERPIPSMKGDLHVPSKKLLDVSGLNLSTQPSDHVNGNGVDISSVCSKKRKDSFSHGTDEGGCLPCNPSSDRLQDAQIHPVEPPWMSAFSGVIKHVYGTVTAAKTIYEDEVGYLIVVTLPFADPERVKVHWWNNLTHAIVKISYMSTSCMPFIQRNNRTFKLIDPFPEHCPPGEFKREIPLPTRIPDDANLEAYFDKSRTVLEIKVPKHQNGPEEHEVPVRLCHPDEPNSSGRSV